MKASTSKYAKYPDRSLILEIIQKEKREMREDIYLESEYSSQLALAQHQELQRKFHWDLPIP
jgi:hypothetical protein